MPTILKNQLKIQSRGCCQNTIPIPSPCFDNLEAWHEFNNIYTGFDGKTKVNDKIGIKDREVLPSTCYKFDGIASVLLPVSISNTNYFCFETYIKKTAAERQTFQSFDAANTNVRMGWWSDSNIFLAFTVGGVIKIGTYPYTNYSKELKIKFVYDGLGATNADKVKIYLNNSSTPVVLNFTGTFPSTTPTLINNLEIGKNVATFSNAKQGTLIKRDSNNDIINRWAFNEASNSYVIDSVGGAEGYWINANLNTIHAIDNDFPQEANIRGYATVALYTMIFPLDNNGDPVIPSGVSGTVTKYEGRVKHYIDVNYQENQLLLEEFSTQAVPTGWTQEFVVDTADWTLNNGGNEGYPLSAYSAPFNNYLQSSNQTDSITRLIMPVQDFLGQTAVYLRFYLAMVMWFSDQDEIKIVYKNDINDPWTELLYINTEIVDWTEYVLNLPNLSSTYYIAFEGNSKYGRGVCLDNVELFSFTETVTNYQFPDCYILRFWDKTTGRWGGNYDPVAPGQELVWTGSELLNMRDNLEEDEQTLFVSNSVTQILAELLTYNQNISGDCLQETEDYLPTRGQA